MGVRVVFNRLVLRQFVSESISAEPKHFFEFDRLPASRLIQKVIYDVVDLGSLLGGYVLLQLHQLCTHPRVELRLLRVEKIAARVRQKLKWSTSRWTKRNCSFFILFGEY
jgi:hypothetical protein